MELRCGKESVHVAVTFYESLGRVMALLSASAAGYGDEAGI
jgi:hypothetical protein